MTTPCVIVAARPVPREHLRHVPAGAFVIAADGGLAQCAALGLRANLAVGDFDSFAGPVPEGTGANTFRTAPEHNGVCPPEAPERPTAAILTGRAPAPEVIRLPAEKNDTDLMFAAREALRRGFDDVTVLGALGGRFDHSFAALTVLLHLAQNGCACRAVGPGCEVACLAPGSHRFTRQAGYLSVFAAGGTARGVTLGGVKYPLDKAALTPDFPLGTSNEFAADEAFVSLTEGYLYVMRVVEDGT